MTRSKRKRKSKRKRTNKSAALAGDGTHTLYELADSRKEERGYLGGFFFIVKNWKLKRLQIQRKHKQNYTNSQTGLQTEKHRQNAEFSKFPNKKKMQFNEQKCNQITNRNAIKSQTERKKMRKRKERSKEKNKE